MAQQWEYITLRISWGKTGDGSKDLEGWTTGDNKYFASLGELLQPWGVQGWELVSVVVAYWHLHIGNRNGEIDVYRAFLKRPKP